MKRASGPLRHRVRVELVLAVAARGPQCWPSRRAAAEELAEVVDAAASTIRRALSDPTLAAEVDLAIELRRPFGDDQLDPVSQEGASGGASRGASSTDPENPQVTDPADEAADEVALHSSTRALLSGPAEVPPVAAGRRPREVRRSRFAGRCVLCLEELAAGRAFYLVPYDTGTAVYCHDHAGTGLAAGQMFYDVVHNRPVPDELELYVRRPIQ